jgi:predicted DNA-binding transcriptional regulator AlpA
VRFAKNLAIFRGSKSEFSDLNPLGFTRTRKAFRLFDYSPSTGYRLIKAGNFPKPIRISAGISAIRNSDLVKCAADPANYKSEEQA